jgi:hypothetical protein
MPTWQLPLKKFKRIMLMKCIIIIVVQVFFTINAIAQSNPTWINLLNTETKAEAIPYYIKQVVLAPTINSIGIVEIRDKQKIIQLDFPLSKEAHVLDFIVKNFVGEKTSTAVILKINDATIHPSIAHKIAPTDTFKFNCEFQINFDGQNETMYTFNAKNAVGSFENPTQAIENYLARALKTAIKKFTAEYNKSKDWNTQSNATKGNVIVVCNHNRIGNKTDSIACDKNVKMSEKFYSPNPKASSKDANTKLILTYKAISTESNNKIKLQIETYALLVKNRSWISGKMSNQENYLLKQQIHFDIVGLFGLKLNKALREYPYTMGEFKSEMNKIYNELNNECTQMRQAFETEIEGNKSNMGTWQQKIAVMFKKAM